MVDILSDLSTLTTLPRTTLDSLIEKECSCICHAVLESELSSEKITEVNIGIGKLQLSHFEDQLEYRFQPSKWFEKRLIETINNKKSPLAMDIEKALGDKLANVYKELL